MQPPVSTPTPRRHVFIAALLLYALVIWPIIHADRFYIDDLGRARSGYLGWTSDGRPLSNLVVETLNLGAPISDLSPLPQLLALLLLAYLAVTLARKFEIPGAWRAPLILAPLAANPFFLENLSYKFDVLPMTLATALSCMAVTAIPRT
ncbi:MAG TPA: glucosyltransferase domain-containing protein, partial [Bordetella sp.]|nr:glucosyltransferase domain-containing protein [Bordetella sp.]